MHIQQIMSMPAVTCRSSDTLSTAAKLMWEYDCGSIPVTDADGIVVGIVTDRDICMATYLKGASPHAISVADTMSKQVFSCRAEESLQTAERLMNEHQVRRIPVIDSDGRAIGLLSLSDIARYAAQKKDGAQQEAIETLAAICQPRPEAARPGAEAAPQQAQLPI